MEIILYILVGIAVYFISNTLSIWLIISGYYDYKEDKLPLLPIYQCYKNNLNIFGKIVLVILDLYAYPMYLIIEFVPMLFEKRKK